MNPFVSFGCTMTLKYHMACFDFYSTDRSHTFLILLPSACVTVLPLCFVKFAIICAWWLWYIHGRFLMYFEMLPVLVVRVRVLLCQHIYLIAIKCYPMFRVQLSRSTLILSARYHTTSWWTVNHMHQYVQGTLQFQRLPGQPQEDEHSTIKHSRHNSLRKSL